MCLSLRSITQLTFTQFNSACACLALASSAATFVPVYASSLTLSDFELSGIVVNDVSDSIAVVFDKQRSDELILKAGDVLAGCVVDYIRRSRVSFYCNDQVHTLTLRSLSLDLTNTIRNDIWSPPVNVTQEYQEQLFNKPANFITAFNLVPHLQDGELTAFEVKSLPEDQDIATALDLQQGDLIVAVNGVSASNAELFSDAFEQIQFTQSVELELIRNDVRYFKNYLLQR